MRLTLGPVQFFWSRERMFGFYEEVARMPVDVVYLGETVCSRRREMHEPQWRQIAGTLAAAGKEVVLSSQVLLESEPDVKAVQRLASNGDFPVEANDMGAVQLMQGRPFVAGASLNVYNEHTLELLARQGATRWVAPAELSGESLAALLAARPGGLQTEVLAYGRVALAYSARCFTARHFNLQKDRCEFRCLDFEDGMLVKTREAQPFLVINGIQTLSYRVMNLVGELPRMAAAGVGLLRISPHARHTGEVVRGFRDVLDGRLPAQQVLREMRQWMPAESCSGFWRGEAGFAETAH